MSPADKKNVMNSSVRIDYDRSSRNVSRVKVIYQNDSNDDYDPRDKLIHDFLFQDDDGRLADFFISCPEIQIPNGIITHIEPVQNKDKPLVLMNLLIHHLKRTGAEFDELKINEFFNQFENKPKRELTKRMTIRGVFETRLSDEERYAAFNNTPKYKWDSDVGSDHEALDIAFDFKTAPEGYGHWNTIYERLKYNSDVDRLREQVSEKIM